MRVVLGSRRRFLFRLALYGFAPCVGSYVLIASRDSLEGRLLGLIGIVVGLLASYLLFSRLRDPLGAIRFAIRPMHIVSRLVAQCHLEGLDRDQQQASIQRFLLEMLPDVEIQERSDSEAKQIALALGEDLLVYVSAPLTKPEDLEILREILEKLRTPLHGELLLVVLTSEPAPLLQAQLRNDLPKVRWLTKRS